VSRYSGPEARVRDGQAAPPSPVLTYPDVASKVLPCIDVFDPATFCQFSIPFMMRV